MAAGSNSEMPSFQDFIQADRKKRKAEELANEIFGNKNRKANAPGAGLINPRRTPNVPSLASRIGITKRSSSASKPAPNKLQSRITQMQRTQSLSNLDRAATSTQRDTGSKQNGLDSRSTALDAAEGIRVKGAAGPYIVVASNFAPGTTAADIEAVMTPVGGEVQYCILVATNPTVIAEMAFLDRAGAENVISMFNNKRADGRLLYVYLKTGAPHQFPKSGPETRAYKPPQRDEDMDVDKDDVNRHAPPTGPRRAEPQYQDGRFGFTESSAPRENRRRREPFEEPRLVSDRMIRREDGRFRR